VNKPVDPSTNPSLRLFRLKFRCFKPIFLLGLALAVSSCSEGGGQSVQTITFGEPDELFVQPIQVCDNSGNNCARVNLFEEITRKILEQAKLKVSFLPVNRLNASRFLSIDDNGNRNSAEYEFYELTRTGGAGAFGRHPASTRNSGPINVWFVNEIEAINGFTQFGLAWVDANGVLISEEALDFGSEGRTDTVAHEIGHNLGLRHTTLGAGGPNNLLTDGDARNIPSSVDDVGPNGAGVSLLTAAQIKEIQSSPFVNSGRSGSNGGEVSLDAQAIANRAISSSVPDSEALNLKTLNLAALDLETPDLEVSDLEAPDLNVRADASQRSAVVSVPEPATDWLGLSVVGLLMIAVRRRL
jgi:hypothetical protein